VHDNPHQFLKVHGELRGHPWHCRDTVDVVHADMSAVQTWAGGAEGLRPREVAATSWSWGKSRLGRDGLTGVVGGGLCQDP
jgi:hypothetical protein